MEMSQVIILILVIIFAGAALSFKPLRKTIGLLFVILGSIACFTIIGLVLGVPMIIIGGIFLFV